MFEEDDEFDFDEGFLQEIIPNNKKVQSRLQENLPSYCTVNITNSNPVESCSSQEVISYEKRSTKNNFPVTNEQFFNFKKDVVRNFDLVVKRKSTNDYETHSKKLCSEENSTDINRKKNFDGSLLEYRPIHNILSIVKNDKERLCYSNDSATKQISTIPDTPKSVSNNLNSMYFKQNFDVKNCNKNVSLKDNLNSKESFGVFNTNEMHSTVLPSKIQKRKFPGPAGLLPDCISPFLNPSEKVFNCDSSNCDSTIMNDDANICSQSTVNLFNGQPWMQMLKDYSVTKNSQTVSLPKKYTIMWLKKNATERKLIKQKSPFLAAIIENIEHFDENHSVLLKDQTGDILGIFNDEVWNEFGKSMQCGSVIVLKQIGVLTTNFILKRHYLNITLNNIVVIYSSNDINAEDMEQQLTMSESNYKITQGLQFMKSTDLISEIEKVKSDYIKDINKNNNKSLENYFQRSNSSGMNLVNKIGCTMRKNVLNNSKSLNIINKINMVTNKPQNNIKISHHSFSGTNSNISVSNSTVTSDFVSKTPVNIRPELRSLMFNRNTSISNMNNLTRIEMPKLINTETTNTFRNDNSSISGKSDIDSILNNTLDGIDTDSLFEDF